MIILGVRQERTRYYSLVNLDRKFSCIGQLFMMDNCPHRYFNEKPKNRFFIKAKGKERKNTPRPSVWMGAVLLSEIGTLGKKLEKQGLFLTISD